jgi:predicted ATP-dependent protease
VEIFNLISEADYWARQRGSERVEFLDIEKAIEEKEFRSNLQEVKIKELIERETLFVDVDGLVVGQVNGLSVLSLGDFIFGKPTRITSTVSLGKGAILDIEREAELSGRIHTKGVLILKSYLMEQFAQLHPLSLSASICFEQSYSGVEGDSASSTELYALLSALSEIPLNQGIAVTGSINQKGQIQPIGGVNEKIRGFFMVCKAKGLTGAQGVLIPKANVKNLMLEKEIVAAVKKGAFHIWAIGNISEGIEILTGKAAGQPDKSGIYQPNTVFGHVQRRLQSFADRLKEFGKAQAGQE